MGINQNALEAKISQRNPNSMLISLKYNFVFFSNPKCASTSIENAIKQYCEISLNSVNIGGKHISPQKFEQSWQPFLKKQYPKSISYQKICTCRHPISKIISWYDYRCREKLLSTKRKNKYLGNTPFEEWCLKEMQKTNTGFFLNNNFKPVVDLIVPMSSLEVLEEHFSSITGKAIHFKQLNSSSSKKTKERRSKKRFEFANKNLGLASEQFIKRVNYYEQLDNIFKIKGSRSIDELLSSIKEIRV